MSALSLPASLGSRAPIALQWIGAHLLAQLVCIATASVGYGIAMLFGVAAPGSTRTFLSAAFAIAVVTELIFVVASAWLRGAVLRQRLPLFPMTLWMVVVAGYMLAIALLSGFATTVPVDGARGAAELTTDTLMKGLMIGTIMGALFGFLVGALEALVIRRAAAGAGVWVLMNVIAWSAMLAILVGSSLLLAQQNPMSAAMTVALGFAMKLVTALVIAVLTLPALRAITPRMIEPAPVAA